MPNNILRTSPLKSFIKKSPLKADKGLINQFEGAYSKPQKKESTLAKAIETYGKVKKEKIKKAKEALAAMATGGASAATGAASGFTSPIKLTEGQKKLDKNKNNKLYSQDFKILRKEKSSPLKFDKAMSMMTAIGGADSGLADTFRKVKKGVSGRFGYQLSSGDTLKFKRSGKKFEDGGKDVISGFSINNKKLSEKRVQKDAQGNKIITKVRYGKGDTPRKVITREKGIKGIKNRKVFSGEDAKKKFKTFRSNFKN